MPQEEVMPPLQDTQIAELASQASVSGPILTILIAKFGEKLVKILLEWLIKNPAQAAELNASMDGVGADATWAISMVKGVVLRMLTQYRAEIVSTATEQVSAVIDLVIAYLQAE